MSSSYPKEHKQIVKDLLDGKFILANDSKYEVIRQFEAYYSEFFHESFDYKMILKSDFVYLISNESAENLSRDISIFLAVLCYELDKDGRNFLDSLNFSEFEHEQIDQYFELTSYKDVIQSNKQLKDKPARINFYNTLARRNIIEKSGDERFTFTPAYKVFVEFAQELAKSKSAGDEEVSGGSGEDDKPVDYTLN